MKSKMRALIEQLAKTYPGIEPDWKTAQLLATPQKVSHPRGNRLSQKGRRKRARWSR